MARMLILLSCCCLTMDLSLSITVDATSESSICTYTFNVPRDGEACQPGTQTQPEVLSLQSTMTKQHANLEQHLNVITEKLDELSCGKDEGNQQGNRSSEAAGITYTHWGRTTCPDTAELIYTGMYVFLILAWNTFHRYHDC